MSKDGCAHQDSHTKNSCGCCVWDRVYNCFRGSDMGDLSERLSPIHEPTIFVNNFCHRGRSTFFLVSKDGCAHQDSHTKNSCGCCVWDRVYNCFRGSDMGDLSERLSPIHEPTIFVNNFCHRGRSTLFLVSLDSCAHQDSHTTNSCGCCIWDRVYNCFRGSDASERLSSVQWRHAQEAAGGAGEEQQCHQVLVHGLV